MVVLVDVVCMTGKATAHVDAAEPFAVVPIVTFKVEHTSKDTSQAKKNKELDTI